MWKICDSAKTRPTAFVDGTGRGQVVPDRLLDDDPRALVDDADLSGAARWRRKAWATPRCRRPHGLLRIAVKPLSSAWKRSQSSGSSASRHPGGAGGRRTAPRRRRRGRSVQVRRERRPHLRPPALVVEVGARDAQDPVVVGELALEVAVVQRRGNLRSARSLVPRKTVKSGTGGSACRAGVRGGGEIHTVHGRTRSTMQAPDMSFQDQRGRLCSRPCRRSLGSGVSGAAGDGEHCSSWCGPGRAVTRSQLRLLTGLVTHRRHGPASPLTQAGLLLIGEELASTGGHTGALVFNKDAGVVLAAAIGRSRSRLAVPRPRRPGARRRLEDHEVGTELETCSPAVAARLLGLLGGVARVVGRSWEPASACRDPRPDARAQHRLAGHVRVGRVELAPYLADVADAPSSSPTTRRRCSRGPSCSAARAASRRRARREGLDRPGARHRRRRQGAPADTRSRRGESGTPWSTPPARAALPLRRDRVPGDHRRRLGARRRMAAEGGTEGHPVGHVRDLVALALGATRWPGAAARQRP